jgi:hypothetical protein
MTKIPVVDLVVTKPCIWSTSKYTLNWTFGSIDIEGHLVSLLQHPARSLSNYNGLQQDIQSDWDMMCQ